uniref:Uncharacterized protein n=1 Tax=Pithovirus LCPAC401 TaxID=2506595 RepID=A0A481ZA51_9VIRU|nr:MAG: hypothetical protein LCPAC401_04410 [Pithovirus LCPAC401]
MTEEGVIEKIVQIKELCEKYLKDHPPPKIIMRDMNYLRQEAQLMLNILKYSENPNTSGIKYYYQSIIDMPDIPEDNKSALYALNKTHISIIGDVFKNNEMISSVEHFDIIVDLCKACIDKMKLYEYYMAFHTGMKCVNSIKNMIHLYKTICTDEEKLQVIDEIIKVF